MFKKLTVLCALMGLSMTVCAQTEPQTRAPVPTTETTATVAAPATTVAPAKHVAKAKHHRAKVAKEITPVNINTADCKELKTIPGLNKKRAEAIVQYRTEHGNFTSVEDLSKVKGFNKKVMGKVSSHLTV